MTIALINHLFHQWQETVAIFAGDENIGRQHFAALVKAYSGSDRFYHNLEHINQVLQTLQLMPVPVEDRGAIQWAAWFHDVIYDSQATDNEARSAVYAEQVLLSLGVSAQTTTTVKQLILATKNHHANPNDVSTCILLDADLAILGTEELAYWEYTKAIRKEYAWVSDLDYVKGRRRVLENFLQRDRLYSTEVMWQTHELKARHNLQAELQRLTREE